MAHWLEIPGLGPFKCWEDALRSALATGEVVEAITYFETALGSSWAGWESGTALAKEFFTNFQNGPCEGLRLYRLLKPLLMIPNCEYVVSKDLGSSALKDYRAAVMALEFCSAMQRAGCEVRFTKPDNDRHGDCEVRLVNQWVTVEFKAVYDSDGEARWSGFIEALCHALHLRDSDFAYFDVVFEMEALDVSIEDIADVMVGISAPVPGVEPGFTPLPGNAGQARRAHGTAGSHRRPTSQKPTTDRIVRNLESQKWWGQLRDVPGSSLLVVRTQDLFDSMSCSAIRELTSSLEPRIARALASKAMISALLVYEEPYLQGPPAPLVENLSAARVEIRTSQIGTTRISILFPSPSPRVRLSDAELDRIVGPTSLLW